MNKNPLIIEPEEQGEIELTLYNVTFTLSALQHALDTEGEDLTMSWNVGQGHRLALQGAIEAINNVAARIELMKLESKEGKA